MDKNISYEQMIEYRKLADYCFERYKKTNSYYPLESCIVNLVFSCEKGFKGIIENNYYNQIINIETEKDKIEKESQLFKICKKCGHNLLMLFNELNSRQKHRLFMFVKNKDIKNHSDLRKFLESEKDTFTNFRFPQEYSQHNKLKIKIKTNISFLFKLNDSLKRMYDLTIKDENKIRYLLDLIKDKYNHLDY